MGLFVKAPLAIVKDVEGKFHHVYEGAPVSFEADKEHLKMLLNDGILGEVEEAAPVEEESSNGAPKGNASREEWAAYATSKGAPEDETKPVDEGGLKQTELRDKYGK